MANTSPNGQLDRYTRATGKSIEEWAAIISRERKDDLNGLSHKDMTQRAVDTGCSPWWAQSFAVEIEKIIGRRVTGQTCNGTFAASASKTIPGEWTEVAEKLHAWLAETPETLPNKLGGEPTITATDKWRYWRARFEDGTQVTVNVCARATGKTKIGLQHDKLDGGEHRLAVKEVWKKVLADFAATL